MIISTILIYQRLVMSMHGKEAYLSEERANLIVVVLKLLALALSGVLRMYTVSFAIPTQ